MYARVRVANVVTSGAPVPLLDGWLRQMMTAATAATAAIEASPGMRQRASSGGNGSANAATTKITTYVARSQNLSTAAVASTSALETFASLATAATRAASPPCATSTLLSAAPASVERIARPTDGTPMGARNSRH